MDKYKILNPLEKPDMCQFLNPEIYEGVLAMWHCSHIEASKGICAFVGNETIWCPLRAHGVTSQTVEDETTEWEIK